MTYIPVGTVLTYTAIIQQSQGFGGFTNWEDLSSRLKVSLLNLPGMEELDVSSVSGNDEFFHVLQAKFSIALEILNNGVDHGSETDIQSIIDGTIMGYGNSVIGSNIIVKSLPNNPTDNQNNEIVINNPNVTRNAPSPTTPSNSGGFSLGLGSLSGGSIAGISITLIVIALIALVLLLPGNARRLVSG